ncbi:MAG: hypothetical protein FJ404_03805 [Verrucomicrobia bacterium]|nr:hypothetical protein [Verrucomicrobiota bacterium]
MITLRLVFSLACAGILAPLPASSATPKEPEAQKEADWVDGRWEKTETGPFLASSVKLPSGWVAKGLSIRLKGAGNMDNTTVLYDTLQGVLRGAWMGNFLKFSPARFGLTDAPQVGGHVVFQSRADASWLMDGRPVPTRHQGLSLRGERVVLEYDVGGVSILESPGIARRGPRVCLVRLLRIGPSVQPLEVPLFQGDRAVASSEQWAGVVRDTTEVWAGLFGNAQASLKPRGSDIYLVVEASPAPRQIEIRIFPELSQPLRAVDFELQASVPADSLEAWLEAHDHRRWGAELELEGKRSLDRDFLAVDEIPVPFDNPWNALMFLSGIDFTPNGDAYVCSIHGDVWRVRGLDDSLTLVKWKRFATGLFQPLGLKVVAGHVCVLGKDQITRLVDTNDDGEADRYENVSNVIATSIGGHDYVTNLETDDEGRFYYVDPRGAHRVSADGTRDELLATGWRNPNGMGLGPGNILTVTPQQGTWTPASAIFEVTPGGYYGFGGPKPDKAGPLGYHPPLCWIPHAVDNSSSSQVWVPAGQWGPLTGSMLHLVWGRCNMMLVLRDPDEGTVQGGVVGLPAKFLSGPMRGRFHQGALYVAGSTGWQTSAVKDGNLARVRFTNKAPRLPLQLRAHQDGVWIRFSLPLEKSTAMDQGSYALKRWNYRYTSQYGSKDYQVSLPDQEGREEVAIESAKLSLDGRSVFLKTGPLGPAMQMELKYNLAIETGESVSSPVWFTVNKPRPAFGEKLP